LKTLKNPEQTHDYTLTDLQDYTSIKTTHYDIVTNACYYVFKLYDDLVISRLYEVFDKYNVSNVIDTLMLGDAVTYSDIGLSYNGTAFVEELARSIKIAYPYINETKTVNFFQKLIRDGEAKSNQYFMKAVKILLDRTIGLNMSENSFVFTLSNFFNYINLCIEEFLEKANEFSNSLSKIDETKYKGVAFLINDFKKFFNTQIPAKKTMYKNVSFNDAALIRLFNMMKDCSSKNAAKIDGVSVNKIYESAINSKSLTPAISKFHADSILDLIVKVNEGGFEDDTLEYDDSIPLYSKKADYMKSYDDMFDKENEMILSGSSTGYRKYYNTMKNGYNDLVLLYKYNTSFDKTFIEDSNIPYRNIGNVENLLSLGETPREIIQKVFRDNGFSLISLNALTTFVNETMIAGGMTNSMPTNAGSNELNAMLNFPFSKIADLTEILNAGNDGETHRSTIYEFSVTYDNGVSENLFIYTVSSDKFIIGNYQNRDRLIAYINMLNDISKFEFIETIEGQHYYKESEHKKSNVFSLKVKNSGLSYETMTFNDVYAFCNSSSSSDAYEVVRDALQSNIVKLIIEDGDVIKISDGSDIQLNEDLLNYKYIKSDLSSETECKIKIRRMFEEAVRKSMHRYVPANTTLWKIKYDN